MPKRRQHCTKCKQVTTQTQQKSGDKWVCLCCESAKYRTAAQNRAIQKNSRAKKRLNISF
jgi:hypothetical protein